MMRKRRSDIMSAEKVFHELVKNIRSNYIKDIDIKVTLSIVVISIDGGENFNNLYVTIQLTT